MIKIAEVIGDAANVAIAGHVRPDGDCVGSCLGLAEYIRSNFPKVAAVDVYLEEIPECFRFLKGADEVLHTSEEEKTYDIFFALDCGDTRRLGEFVKYFNTAKHTVCIDHHISNAGYADVNYIVPDASSASELVYETTDEEKIPFAAAEALYMGIAHDTGVFQYSCTSQRTMEIAGKLMAKGIPFSKIVDDTFFNKTYLQKQILGRALLESMMVLDGKVIVSAVRKKDMDFYRVGPSDLDGIVSQLRSTVGVEAAIFIYETANHEYKVSMRSNNDIDVSKIASYFGGGGHIKAAGCTMQGNLHDVINNLTLHIENQMKEAARENDSDSRNN